LPTTTLVIATSNKTNLKNRFHYDQIGFAKKNKIDIFFERIK